MPKTFEDHLARVSGTVHRVNMANHHERMRDGLLYYWNRAEALKTGATIISDAHGPSEVFALLAGLSIELLLKGTRCALAMPESPIHKLNELRLDVGIPLSEDDEIILDALTEKIIWQAKYPTPKRAQYWPRAWAIRDKQVRPSGNLRDMFIPGREISVANYNRLWEFFAGYYHKAREARRESAEFDYGNRE